jgi:hypothetical protein
MDQFVVHRSGPLRGSVRAGGSQELGAQVDGGLPAGRRAPRACPGCRTSSTSRSWPTCCGPSVAGSRGPSPVTTADREISSSTSRPSSSPRRPTSWWRRCARRWSSSGRCWPARAGPGCRCPVATTSATGRSTSISRVVRPGGVLRDGPRLCRRRRARRRCRWPVGGQPGGVRVPEPHGHRQRPHGGGVGQGHHGPRERRPRARGGRSGRVPHRHGGTDHGGGNVADRGGRGRRAPPDHPPGHPRPGGGGHVLRRRRPGRGGRRGGRRPGQPHGHALAEVGRDGGAHLPDARGVAGAERRGGCAVSTSRRCRTRGWPPTTSRSW